jgi:hypothetical protein
MRRNEGTKDLFSSFISINSEMMFSNIANLNYQRKLVSAPK